VAYFAFLHAGELTVPDDSFFHPLIYLSWGDLAVDAPANPTVLSMRLKASKMDSFLKGIILYIGRVPSDLCPVSALLAYLVFRGKSYSKTANHSRGRGLWLLSAMPCTRMVWTPKATRVTVLESALLLWNTFVSLDTS